jgi:hypothetical protein
LVTNTTPPTPLALRGVVGEGSVSKMVSWKGVLAAAKTINLGFPIGNLETTLATALLTVKTDENAADGTVTAVTAVPSEFLQGAGTYLPPSPLAPGSNAQIPDVGGPATSDQKNPGTLQGVGGCRRCGRPRPAGVPPFSSVI